MKPVTLRPKKPVTLRPKDWDKVAERTREQRLRRMAERYGLGLQKSRRRDPRALDYNKWWVVDPYNGNLIRAGGQWGMSLDDVEAWLTSD